MMSPAATIIPNHWIGIGASICPRWKYGKPNVAAVAPADMKRARAYMRP